MSNFTQVHIYWVFLSTIICILIVPREWKIGEKWGWGEGEIERGGEAASVISVRN
jgi:hypothetical protein